DLVAGADVATSALTHQSAFTGRVGERVNGIAARAWDLVDPAAESVWKSTTFDAFVSDTVALTPKLSVNGGLRVETVRGFARDTAREPAVSWQGLYPRAGLPLSLTDFWNIGAFAQYGRYPHRLPLRDLAYGDPTAPTATVYRWNGGSLLQPGSLGP